MILSVTYPRPSVLSLRGQTLFRYPSATSNDLNYKFQVLFNVSHMLASTSFSIIIFHKCQM